MAARAACARLGCSDKKSLQCRFIRTEAVIRVVFAGLVRNRVSRRPSGTCL